MGFYQLGVQTGEANIVCCKGVSTGSRRYCTQEYYETSQNRRKNHSFCGENLSINIWLQKN